MQKPKEKNINNLKVTAVFEPGHLSAVSLADAYELVVKIIRSSKKVKSENVFTPSLVCGEAKRSIKR